MKEKKNILTKKLLPWIATYISIFGTALFVIEYGFYLPYKTARIFHFFIYLCSIILISQFFLKLIFLEAKEIIKEYKIELILISFFGIFLILLKTHFLHLKFLLLRTEEYVFLCQIFVIAFFLLKLPQISKLFFLPRLSPPLIVAVTFLFIICIGTFLLYLPLSTAPGKNTSFLDALFTATSATCVTGLIVVDTGSHFSIFGQIVILSLIQIGGLGLMTFASFFALLSGGLGLKERVVLREAVRYQNLSKIGYLVLYILLLTFIIESAGALLLYFQFLPQAKNSLSAFYSALFHSISAFCNAGFSIYPDSFIKYQKNTYVNLTMTSLIICGGLGFVVIVNLLDSFFAWFKKRKRTISLHTKLVIVTTLILIATGTFFIYLGEKNNLLKDMTFKNKILASFFQSVTARTAGFNTIPIDKLTKFSSFLLIILMFIGASPGSTGGGIKTSTFATLILAIKSMIQGKHQVEAFKRTIPQIYIYQALCVVTLALGWSSISTLFLSFTENADFLNILFEVFSALGTVGLSRGITSHLTNFGKIIIIITIFVGRVGPLTLALAISGKKVAKLYEYPEESIIIG